MSTNWFFVVLFVYHYTSWPWPTFIYCTCSIYCLDYISNRFWVVTSICYPFVLKNIPEIINCNGSRGFSELWNLVHTTFYFEIFVRCQDHCGSFQLSKFYPDVAIKYTDFPFNYCLNLKSSDMLWFPSYTTEKKNCKDWEINVHKNIFTLKVKSHTHICKLV